MKQCFISHCSDDKEEIVAPLMKLLSAHYPNDCRFFCSSVPETALRLGVGLGSGLKQELKESDCMIAIMTDNYLRSPISLVELSAMWYRSDDIEQILPIVFTPLGADFLQKSFVARPIYLDATTAELAVQNSVQLIASLEKSGFSPLNSALLQTELNAFFQTLRRRPSARPYIGSGETYDNINRYCAEHGVTQIFEGAVPHELVRQKLGEKQTLYFVMTTGSAFIDNYAKDFLQAQVARGTTIYMILPNRNSDFCMDVAEIENPECPQVNMNRLTTEFDSVVAKLKFVLHEAKTQASDPDCIGRIFLCAAYTLLRQTVCLGNGDIDGCWGWITTTMPPRRAVGNTPTLLFEGNLRDKLFFGHAVYGHVSQMIELARKRGGLIDLAAERDFSSFQKDEIVDLGERTELEKEWKEKYALARKKLDKRQRLKSFVLIEIAAQHPLNGSQPGEEFRARLDYGFHLYQQLSQEGKEVSIYVPGSVHLNHGVAEPVSLSEAGCRYLLDLGVPELCLLGENENQEYMQGMGVYNSCDECYVSSKLFHDGGYGDLHCICSPNQALRKQLFYINFGVIPVMHTVRTSEMYHDFTQELFHSVPTVLYRYPNWSDPNCPLFHKSREERMPGYREKA